MSMEELFQRVCRSSINMMKGSSNVLVSLLDNNKWLQFTHVQLISKKVFPNCGCMNNQLHEIIIYKSKDNIYKIITSSTDNSSGFGM